MHKESGQLLAIKQVPVDSDLQDIIKEISIMQQCDRYNFPSHTTHPLCSPLLLSPPSLYVAPYVQHFLLSAPSLCIVPYVRHFLLSPPSLYVPYVQHSLLSLPSLYVVKYYGSYFKNTDLWVSQWGSLALTEEPCSHPFTSLLQIVMEYCGAGSVSDIMRIINRPVSSHPTSPPPALTHDPLTAQGGGDSHHTAVCSAGTGVLALQTQDSP